MPEPDLGIDGLQRPEARVWRENLWSQLLPTFRSEIRRHSRLSEGMLGDDEVGVCADLALEETAGTWEPAKGGSAASGFRTRMKWRILDRLRKKGFFACPDCNPHSDNLLETSCIRCRRGWRAPHEQDEQSVEAADPKLHAGLFTDRWTSFPSGVVTLRPDEIDPGWIAQLPQNRRPVVEEVLAAMKPVQRTIWWLYAQDILTGRMAVEDWMIPEDGSLSPDEIRRILGMKPDAVYHMGRRMTDQVVVPILRRHGFLD